MENLSAIENVVRVIFPSTMMNEGELLPAAFKLRHQKDTPEKYISVFRQYVESFNADILRFDKSRNLPCCILNVGEVNDINLRIANAEVKYSVHAVPTETSPSHAGIFTHLGDLLIEGNGHGAFSALGLGENSNPYLIAIRRRLVDIAKKRMTTVPQLATDADSGTCRREAEIDN